MMRRSFGPMGGGGGGGGGMMRTVHRAVRAGSGSGGRGSGVHNSSTNSSISKNTYKPSSSSDNNSNSNSNSNSNNDNNNSNTLSFSSNHHPSPFSSVNHHNDEEYDDFVFCSVPSIDEVHHAVSSLQQVLDPAISYEDSGWEFDWIEPSTSMLQSGGSQSVYDAFHLLQTEPSVKKMVTSLSSDKSVWEAVMNNEAVRELRDSVNQANKSIAEISDKVDSSDGLVLVSDVIHWIFNNTKAKVIEIIEKTTEMMNKLFQSSTNERKANGDNAATETFEKKIRSSFFLSVMVLLIVVVTRVSRS